jgi:hypothetical protein
MDHDLRFHGNPGGIMKNDIQQNELEEIARLEFNNNAMAILADQCMALKKQHEAEILKNYIMMNEISLAHIKSLHSPIGTNFNRNVRRQEGQPWARIGLQRWGLFARVERLLLG